MSDSAQILVVDDQQEICDVVQEYLTGEGYRVATAHDGGGMRRVMTQGHVDLVIIDSAPILRVADSLELIDQADLIMLVARRKVSRMHSLSAAADRIRQIGGNLSGCVFNGVDTRDSSYGYGYPPKSDDKVRKARRPKSDEKVSEEVSASGQQPPSG